MKYKEKEIEFTLSLSLADLLAVPGCSIHSLDPHWLMYIRRRFPFAYSAGLGVRCALTKKKKTENRVAAQYPAHRGHQEAVNFTFILSRLRNI